MRPRSADTPMDRSRYAALPTSIASPAAFGKLGVAMTRGSLVVQFLSCETGYQLVLQRDCCLNCAAEVMKDKSDVIINMG